MVDPFVEVRNMIDGRGPRSAREACMVSRRATAHIRDRIKAIYLHESLAAALCMIDEDECVDTMERAARRRRAANIAEIVAHS